MTPPLECRLEGPCPLLTQGEIAVEGVARDDLAREQGCPVVDARVAVDITVGCGKGE